MHSIDPIDAREARIATIGESVADAAALRRHLKEIIEGKAFKGSPRSIQFLEYIVEQALAGQFDALKERVIGVELFGRSPSYETGEDAIVRVTASEVRKRLLRHYSIYGQGAEFHLSLPLGSYILDITRGSASGVGEPDAASANSDQAAATLDLEAGHRDPNIRSDGLLAASSAVVLSQRQRSLGGLWLFISILIIAVCVLAWAASERYNPLSKAAQVSVLPWSVFLSSPRSTVLVTSDPNIAEIQGLTGIQISVSDYANHIYVPEPNKLSPEVEHICKWVLIGNKSASIDTQIAVDIEKIAAVNAKRIDVRPARSIQLSDLHTPDNFIFLASQRSDPWFELFNNQLDFRIASNKTAAEDTVVNVHPHANELPVYVPTARGGATGQTFAIIALVQNLDQDGHVLLLSGASAEGTEAAGKFVVDLPRLSTALQNCGIAPSGPLRQFELLLRVNTMARSPNSFDVVACHILTSTAAQ
jgi:hypothetical protein